MAEKKEKKPYTLAIDTPIEFALLIIFVVGAFTSISTWLSKNKETVTLYYEKISFYVVNYFAKFAVFSAFFSGAAIIVLAIYLYKYQKTREEFISRVLPHDEYGTEIFAKEDEHPKWKVVVENINSDDPNKWKFAILEADIILADLLDALDLPGDNIGDKLKAIEPSDFQTIEEAWEAHKIRNVIAHEGSDFLLSQREAKRIIGLYEKVFEEFDII